MSTKVRVLIAVGVVIAVVISVVLLVPTRDSHPILRAAFNVEFLFRPECYDGLCKHYDFEFQPEPVPVSLLDLAARFEKLNSGEVDVIEGFATDGAILEHDLVVLKDDADFFLPYEAAPRALAST